MMKKLILAIAVAATCLSAQAFQRAFYVKQGEAYTKYNFGVASDLKFFDNGTKLKVTGYKETIDLSAIDCIEFDAPVDQIALTPAEQKQKLIDVAHELYGKIDLDKVAMILRAVNAFGNEKLLDNEYRWHRSPFDYYVPREYWDVHHQTAKIIKAMGNAVSGNPTALRTVANSIIELYKLSDFYGVYFANDKTFSWEKSPEKVEYVELRYNNNAGDKEYTVRLEPSSAKSSSWETSDFAIEVPERMTFTVKENNAQAAACEIVTVLDQNKSININVSAKAGDAYFQANVSHTILNEGITEVTEVKLNNEKVFGSTIVLDGRNLLDYDAMKEAIDGSFEKEIYDAENDRYNYIDGDPTALFGHADRLTVHLDALGKLQIDGKVFDFQKLYNVLQDEEDDNYEYDLLSWDPESGILQYATNDKAHEQAIVDHLANYADVQFSYDNTRKLQGFMEWDVDDSKGDEWTPTEYEGFLVKNGKVRECWSNGNYFYYYDKDGKHAVSRSELVFPLVARSVYYEAAPLLMFTDLSSYKYDDFFEKVSFDKVITDYDSFLETYNTLLGIVPGE